ncbi:MAG TPA: phosphoribosyltransferase [Ktedonobacteraceae bacterium]|nr:phosphoribosyltransferase [Ktedonobacteraceae bacterium]
MPRYQNRLEAGRYLATLLTKYAHRPDVIVLALPRGGVPVGYEVAKALHVPLDVFIVRKLGVPGHEELAMGAIATGGVQVLNHEVVNTLHIPPRIIEMVAAQENKELQRRERLYRDDRPQPDVKDKTVILVDDGLATGSTMQAAIEALKQEHPAHIVVAVPVAALSTCEELGQQVYEIICAQTPEPFYGVGFWYEDFSQTSDQEVHDLLAQAQHAQPVGANGQ